MPQINTASRSIQVKIVYYGPGLSGKTTNLKQLKKALSKDRVGEMMSLDTKGDRTLFFDWVPVKLGKIRGFDIKIQLYTVPGQIRYNKTRRQVLRGVDGVVFVADSQKAASEQNIYSFNNLRENLSLLNINLEDLPLVIQCNKKDLPETMSTREMALLLNSEHIPFTEAIAFKGKGVSETLRLITRLALKKIQKYLDPERINQLKSSDMPLDGDSLLQDIINDEDLIREINETENSDENSKKIEKLEIPEPSGEEKNAKASLGLQVEFAGDSDVNSSDSETEEEKDKEETTPKPVITSEQVESFSKSEKQQQEIEMETKSSVEEKNLIQGESSKHKIEEKAAECTPEPSVKSNPVGGGSESAVGSNPVGGGSESAVKGNPVGEVQKLQEMELEVEPADFDEETSQEFEIEAEPPDDEEIISSPPIEPRIGRTISSNAKNSTKTSGMFRSPVSGIFNRETLDSEDDETETEIEEYRSSEETINDLKTEILILKDQIKILKNNNKALYGSMRKIDKKLNVMSNIFARLSKQLNQ